MTKTDFAPFTGRRNFRLCLLALAALLPASAALGQAVCLPAPRLLTTMPMGGQVGSTLEVTIAGENIDDADLLNFSHPGLTAKPFVDEAGQPVANRFVVSIADDCPPGLHETRVMTRLGVSSSRIFNVGKLPEVTRQTPNTTLETALPIDVGSVCNAVMSPQAVDHYSFEARQGQRIVVDCGAEGIDSRLKAVLIVADAAGNDLKVERRGGAVDFTAPADGTYLVKVHDLTFNGGPHYFYRLVLQEAAEGELVPRLPSTRAVSSASWPPVGLAEQAPLEEVEPNDAHAAAQQITLPADISGSFYPAADVDTFEFTAAKGEVWWVEVASQRLGRPTDPAIVVQHVAGEGENQTLTDVVELSDIASPVKVSSNGYSYDGPPYNVGSTDILGKLEIAADGVHRLQLHDLFGGTRSDPANVYRLIIRKAEPDFALAAWGLHMNLRNGDRNALSKPIALRGGTTLAIEVVAVRRDGFDGEIELFMDDLPEGVTATGLKIPTGQSRGIMLITADETAPRGLTNASFYGKATIDGVEVTRPCALASMAWPVPDAWSAIPAPRLLQDVPVSVCGTEQASITVAAADQIFEAKVGEKLTIPLTHARRCEFSGASMSLKTFGAGLDGAAAFDVPLNADASEAVLDLAALKTPPGEYVIAFYGSAVAKYRDNPEAVAVAQATLNRVQEQAAALAAQLQQLTETAESGTGQVQEDARRQIADITAQHKAAEAAAAAADKQVKAAESRAQPKDIVDIVVSRPLTIRVSAGE
jgi:hypothetical protein